MTNETPKPARDRTMPVWLAVGIAAILVAVLIRSGSEEATPLFPILLVGGLLATAYGIGQYRKG